MKTLLTFTAVICLAGAALGQQPSPAPKLAPEHEKLQIWIGDWQYEGQLQNSPMGPGGRFVGKETARPVLGGFFVEFRGEETGPAGAFQWQETDRYDLINTRYTWSSLGSDGSTSVVVYTIDGTTVPYSGTIVLGATRYQIRGTAVFAADLMSFVDKREYSTDGKTWAPLFESKSTKIKAAPATALQELGDLLVARWTSDVTWAVDYPGLGKKGERVAGFEVWKRMADGAALECDYLLGATCGRTVIWWDAAAKQIRTLDVDSGGNWAQGTITRQGTKWVWATAGSFADGRRVEYQSETTFPDNGRSRITRGVTILEGVRNEFRDVFRRVAN